MWFDVGVFKTLYCEVTHYFLPSENGDMASILSAQNSSDSEVCLQHLHLSSFQFCVGVFYVTAAFCLTVEAAGSS